MGVSELVFVASRAPYATATSSCRVLHWIIVQPGISGVFYWTTAEFCRVLAGTRYGMCATAYHSIGECRLRLKSGAMNGRVSMCSP